MHGKAECYRGITRHAASSPIQVRRTLGISCEAPTSTGPVSFIPLFDGFSFVLLQQFQTIAERIVDVAVRIAVQGLTLNHFVPSRPERNDQLGQVCHQESRVSLSRWPKGRINTQVNLDTAALEPHPAARNEMCWLGYLRQAKKLSIEAPGPRLLSRRHGQLNVVNTDYPHPLLHVRRTLGISCEAPILTGLVSFIPLFDRLAFGKTDASGSVLAPQRRPHAAGC
jgi:hypothetical protein